MPSYYPPDDSSSFEDARPPRRSQRGGSRGYDDYDPRQQLPKTAARAARESSRHDSPRDEVRDRKARQKDVYDASDEDDVAPPKRSERKGRDGSPPIPRPPLGEDRGPSVGAKKSRHRGEDANGGEETTLPSRSRAPANEAVSDDPPPPYKPNARDQSYGAQTKPRRGDHGRDHDDGYRRSKRDDRTRRQPAYDDESEYEHKPRRRGDRDRDRYDKYEDRGYRSEAPRRRDRDAYDRGYGTDYGRRPKRDRERDRPRDAGYGGSSGRHRRDYDDYDRRHDRRDRERDRDPYRESERDRDPYRDAERDRYAGGGRERRSSGRKKLDMGQVMQQGQKHWQTVAPVAKPALAALAKKYLVE
ncbi:hypothetical protein EJ03DRAFT_46165 [Teratosphaeria nubilosa]|uniref:Uncharacterized protein n=1 Tax=Teratosphaeria nubilosa TaxID=161662 RepID=A0A6G1LG55_9PEZI|nr:hypothetical protein EJ03DRAFT_46165 [Teratosphaeria nubilosa]